MCLFNAFSSWGHVHIYSLSETFHLRTSSFTTSKYISGHLWLSDYRAKITVCFFPLHYFRIFSHSITPIPVKEKLFQPDSFPRRKVTQYQGLDFNYAYHLCDTCRRTIRHTVFSPYISAIAWRRKQNCQLPAGVGVWRDCLYASTR